LEVLSRNWLDGWEDAEDWALAVMFGEDASAVEEFSGG